MGDDPAAAQLLEEVLSTVERFHFDIDAADLGQGMRVGTGAGWNSKTAAQLLGPLANPARVRRQDVPADHATLRPQPFPGRPRGCGGPPLR